MTVIVSELLHPLHIVDLRIFLNSHRLLRAPREIVRRLRIRVPRPVRCLRRISAHNRLLLAVRGNFEINTPEGSCIICAVSRIRNLAEMRKYRRIGILKLILQIVQLADTGRIIQTARLAEISQVFISPEMPLADAVTRPIVADCGIVKTGLVIDISKNTCRRRVIESKLLSQEGKDLLLVCQHIHIYISCGRIHLDALADSLPVRLLRLRNVLFRYRFFRAAPAACHRFLRDASDHEVPGAASG